MTSGSSTIGNWLDFSNLGNQVQIQSGCGMIYKALGLCQEVALISRQNNRFIFYVEWVKRIE